MKLYAFIVFTLIGSLPVQAGAEMYQWTNPDGSVDILLITHPISPLEGSFKTASQRSLGVIVSFGIDGFLLFLI